MLAADRRLWKHAAQLIQGNHRLISKDTNSDAHFWYDVWTGDTPLKAYIPEDKWQGIPDKLCTIQQAFCTTENAHLQAAILHCPRHLLNQFLTTNKPTDRWIWCLNSNGHFSTKSVRTLLQPESSSEWNALWSPYIPLKWSIFLWRMVQNLVPVDGTIKETGVPLCSKCSCCVNSHQETVQHLFFSSEVASHIWNEMFSLLQFRNVGITNVADGIFSFLTRSDITTATGRLQRCTFMAVLWELWCSRNIARFQGKAMSAKHVINQSLLLVRAICISANFQKIPQPWLSALRQPMSGTDDLKVMVPKSARWLTPPPGRLKLNTDGALNLKSDEAGGGGIIRDHNGQMCGAFASPYHGLHTSLVAEALALRDGLRMCSNMGIYNVMVETDSLSLVQIVTNQISRQWDLSFILREIAVIAEQVKAEIVHTPREGNKLTDSLAGYAVSCAHFSFWDSWANLPNSVLDIYCHEKAECPSMPPESVLYSNPQPPSSTT
ncbi:hypothetical protein Taro_008743 [Colocasia esculenta]|uniref:RNase H type-1 domain-containing protein n=1 Tax=Colocasia esculenta TaxID=4460 RepID=A0A843U4C3_COLES|nr:hypothetical protein [Colocasia esculenta]